MREADAVVRNERNSARDEAGFKTKACIKCVGITVLNVVFAVIFLMGLAQISYDINFFSSPSSVKVDAIPMRVNL